MAPTVSLNIQRGIFYNPVATITCITQIVIDIDHRIFNNTNSYVIESHATCLIIMEIYGRPVFYNNSIIFLSVISRIKNINVIIAVDSLHSCGCQGRTI